MNLFNHDFESVAQFFSMCNDILERDEKLLNLSFSLVAKGYSLETIAEIAKKRNMHFDFIKTSDNLYRCSLGVRKECIKAYIVTYEDYWLYVLSDETDATSINSFIRNLSPLLKLCYLDTNKISRLIQKLIDEYDEIYLIEGLLIREGEKIKSWKRKPVKIDASTIKRIEEDESAKWLNVKLKFGNTGKSGWGKVRIYSMSQITIYRGRFIEIFDNVVNTYIQGAIRNDKLFTGKEVSIKDNTIEIKPITINFSQEISKAQIEMLKERLSSIYMSTVVYSGNPFLLIQLTDKHDGSSYDFYARQKKIDIVPMLKANSSSLTQLFALTSNILPEGVIPSLGG